MARVDHGTCQMRLGKDIYTHKDKIHFEYTVDVLYKADLRGCPSYFGTMSMSFCLLSLYCPLSLERLWPGFDLRPSLADTLADGRRAKGLWHVSFIMQL